jgi:hypothetical protein
MRKGDCLDVMLYTKGVEEGKRQERKRILMMIRDWLKAELEKEGK